MILGERRRLPPMQQTGPRFELKVGFVARFGRRRHQSTEPEEVVATAMV